MSGLWTDTDVLLGFLSMGKRGDVSAGSGAQEVPSSPPSPGAIIKEKKH